MLRAYWAALRMRLLWGVPSGLKGVWPTVVSPMTSPPPVTYQSAPLWMPPGKVCITTRLPFAGAISSITFQCTPV